MKKSRQEQLFLFDKPFVFERGKRPVHYVVEEVKVNGQWFDLVDLDDTLGGVADGDVKITNRKMCDHLKELGVLKSCGGRDIGASQGRRFKEFKALIEEMIKEVWDEPRSNGAELEEF